MAREPLGLLASSDGCTNACCSLQAAGWPHLPGCMVRPASCAAGDWAIVALLISGDLHFESLRTLQCSTRRREPHSLPCSPGLGGLMGDPLGALSMAGEPLQAPQPQQEQRPPGESVAAAAAATATATAAAAAAAIRTAAAAIRTAAAALPLQPQQRDSPMAAAAAAGESGQGGSAASLSHPLGTPASPTSSAAGEAPPPPPSPAERAQLFRQQLAAEPAIDMRALRGLAYGGVPDDARGLRAAVWRLLLGLLPPERGQWERVLRRKRAEYAQFCEVGVKDCCCLLDGWTSRCSQAATGMHACGCGAWPRAPACGTAGAAGRGLLVNRRTVQQFSARMCCHLPLLLACLQELIVDPKNLSTPANLEAAPGSQPNPLLAHGSAASSSSSMSAAAAAADGSGSAPGSAPGSARAAAAAAAAAAEAELQRLALSQDDHPLSTSSSSKWKAYFQVRGGGWQPAWGVRTTSPSGIRGVILERRCMHACSDAGLASAPAAADGLSISLVGASGLPPWAAALVGAVAPTHAFCFALGVLPCLPAAAAVLWLLQA